MTFVITSPCIGSKDASCLQVCPVDCIHDIGPLMVIDPDTCIDCGACEAECPVEAIHHERLVPAEESVYLAVTAAYPQGLDAVGALIDLSSPNA